MRETLMRLVALAAATAVSDVLTPDGALRQAARFIGALATVGAMLDLIDAAKRAIGL